MSIRNWLNSHDPEEPQNFLSQPLSDAMLGIQEANRLLKIAKTKKHHKQARALKQQSILDFVNELAINLVYLEIDGKEFIQQLKQELENDE